jgi:hypothetical protein
MEERPDVISAVEARKLLADFNGQQDSSLTARLLMDCYQLNDGRILVAEWAADLVFIHQGDVLRKMLSDFDREDVSPRHMWARVNSYGPQFPAHVPELIDRLAVHLSIPADELELTLRGVKAVDDALKRMDFYWPIESELTTELAAYVGELARIATQGQWIVELADDGETWVPSILAANGQRIDLLRGLWDAYDGAYEESEPTDDEGPFSFAISEFYNRIPKS